MTQLELGPDLTTKRTRKRTFLDAIRRVVPWSRLIALIESRYPKGKTGRPLFPLATVLLIQPMQERFGLSDPAEARTGQRDPGADFMRTTDSVVGATFTAPPGWTKNKSGKRDLEVSQGQRGGNRYFGMKEHIGATDESGRVHVFGATAFSQFNRPSLPISASL